MKAIVFVPDGRVGLDDSEPPLEIAHIVILPEPTLLRLRYSLFLRSDDNRYGVEISKLEAGSYPHLMYGHQTAQIELSPEEEAICLAATTENTEAIAKLGYSLCGHAIRELWQKRRAVSAVEAT